jgi:hypothetical protein
MEGEGSPNTLNCQSLKPLALLAWPLSGLKIDVTIYNVRSAARASYHFTQLLRTYYCYIEITKVLIESVSIIQQGKATTLLGSPGFP